MVTQKCEFVYSDPHHDGWSLGEEKVNEKIRKLNQDGWKVKEMFMSYKRDGVLSRIILLVEKED